MINRCVAPRTALATSPNRSAAMVCQPGGRLEPKFYWCQEVVGLVASHAKKWQ